MAYQLAILSASLYQTMHSIQMKVPVGLQRGVYIFDGQANQALSLDFFR